MLKRRTNGSHPRTALVILATMLTIALSARSGIARAQAVSPAGSRLAAFRPLVLGDAFEQGHMRIVTHLHPAVPIHGFRDEGALGASIAGTEYVHIASTVRGRTGNPYGFRNGESIFGITIKFTLTHRGTGAVIEGQLYPMVTRNGPQYGINVRMLGEGEYTLVLYLQPPSAKVLTRVTGKPLGVPAWWTPFDVAIAFGYTTAEVFPE